MSKAVAYKILRAPLVASFEVPTQEELLALKVGDVAKLIFHVGTDKPERMWLTLTDCSNPEQWIGELETTASQPATLAALPKGSVIAFHPRDIVSVE